VTPVISLQGETLLVMTDKVRVVFRVKPEVKNDMDLIYNTLHKGKHRGQDSRWCTEMSRNLFWEIAISDYLQRKEIVDLLAFLKKEPGGVSF
jgi:hypothetical protein